MAAGMKTEKLKKTLAWVILAAAAASLVLLVFYALTFPVGRIVVGVITAVCLTMALLFWAIDEVGR